MTELFKTRFFCYFTTLVFSLISVYISGILSLQIVLWSFFLAFIIYLWQVEKVKIALPLLLLPIMLLSGGIESPALPMIFLGLPFVLKKYGVQAFAAVSIVTFIVFVCAGDLNNYRHFVIYLLFIFSAVGVWFYIEKSFAFLVNQPKTESLKISAKTGSSLVEDPFGPLKKYLVRTTNFDNKPISLRLVELLPDDTAKIYDSDNEFKQQGLLFRVVHDKTSVAAKTLLSEREDIPMMPEFDFRIYYPVYMLECDDKELSEPEYVLVVDISLDGKAVDKDALIEKFGEIRDEVTDQLKQAETFSHISIEKQRNAALYRETSNIVDSFDHDELLKASALAIFNLAPEASGVFVTEKKEEFSVGYAFKVKPDSKGKWPLEMTDICEPEVGELKDCQAVHSMMTAGKLDDYYEACDVDKRKKNPIFPPEFDSFNKKSAIAIRRMAFNNAIKGTISVLTDSQADFDKLREHFDSIRMISKVVTSALNNIELFEKMEDLSNIDTLTELFNRRCFNNTLERKIGEVSRVKVELSMIMIDIDHFKKVNDTYGHKAGDDVIRFVSKTIKNSIRKVDFAARYGGEEFVILLNNTTIEAAARIAEKIRNIIRSTSVNADGVLLSVTASFGVSSYPELSQSSEDLIKNADSALYWSKEHGRDQVTVFSKEILNPDEQD